MKDIECVAFLQWALPRLHRRWAGFRKVRAQVCKRIDRREKELGLPGTAAYRDYLEQHPAEWEVLDRLCPITISSFYRDRAVFDFIASRLLPQLARAAADRGRRELRALSIGCASGEEPYSLMLAWRLAVAPVFPGITLRIVATDALEETLERARSACYRASSLKHLPAAWREPAFERRDDEYCLKAGYRGGVEFLRQDVREGLPPETFDLILCRNLVFTYFDEATQREILGRLAACLRPEGVLVLGHRERLPPDSGRFTPWPGAEALGIFRPGRDTHRVNG